MTAAQADPVTTSVLEIDSPRVEDGAAIWRIARDSQVLDLNSSYSYLLWCRDFATTSVVARDRPGGDPIAFVTGYVRPERPETLVVWQVAVDNAHRGRGLAGTLLDALTLKVAASHGITTVETTITPDNVPSDRLFTSYAERRGASVSREVLFDAGVFPADPGESHLPEVLYRIAPVAA
ncbi:L-2,4-diaminobutyric acid acetyltransferase [Streptomyces spiroverticillatus]|uniref:diaminobutyrate acetyltransferase n=1 Tax=Streptomyces finlayi TaxID=67296 RepID=UPI0016740C05|nr:diaminobutyrate acetyltransferase [Streptomyces finlayi]